LASGRARRRNDRSGDVHEWLLRKKPFDHVTHLCRGFQTLYNFSSPHFICTLSMILEPLELAERLAARVPPHRFKLTRYHGVPALSAGWRPLVIPKSGTFSPLPHRNCPARNQLIARNGSGPKPPLLRRGLTVRRIEMAALSETGAGAGCQTALCVPTARRHASCIRGSCGRGIPRRSMVGRNPRCSRFGVRESRLGGPRVT